MATMIRYNGQLLRISPKNPSVLEYSQNNGITWMTRYHGSPATGIFSDLMDNGNELLATTSKGLLYSRNGGTTWMIRKRN